MKSVPVNDLIEVFQTMYEEHWKYEWGHHEYGCVDCSGAFVYAFQQFGISYPNGSNNIARNYTVGKLLPISEAEPGMAAFKAKEPGEDGYDLPDKYKIGGNAYNGDLKDYYHIGLVDIDPKYVLNAKGTKYGFCRDALTEKNGWDYVAELKYVDYEAGGESGGEKMKARVVLPAGATGSTVNMRKSASKSADIVCKVPVGAEIDVISDQGQWCEIDYDGRVGYMMSNYIEYDGQDGETETLTPENQERIDQALKTIEEQIEIIGSITGRG